MSIGKLDFDGGMNSLIDAIKANGFLFLEIDIAHVKEAAKLPYFHRDPFDRMLISQACVNNMSIMTVDSNIRKYNVEHIWD
ncbi:MAG: type II toxin-antitoxin system VapC family toxin [Defluviitaleaceae bacterium]|nr:type II toxin-antitoxin system VapC family toxin [Defluviitaleaceae bacterium]